MDKWKKRSVDLFTSLAFGADGGLSVVPYYPQKLGISSHEDAFFPRTIPEKKGISSKRIYHMLCELEREKRANVHSLLILCGGEVICGCSRDGYGVNVAHISHSMSKSVTGMVIGRLWDEGKIGLDDRLVDFFPEIKYRDKRFPQITVEHLLTMSCGIDFAELGSITDRNWTEAYFASPVKFAPGGKFLYNSMNSYLLARIAERASSKSFIELAREGIFEPMEISNYLWEKGPEGVEKAGWGLYMSCESWAKLGYMLLRGGDFFGKRILSSDWIKRCSETKAIVPEENGDFNYTYQMWRARSSDELLFNGMLGQNVWICPKNDIVAVVTGGNNELFADSAALEIIRKNLGCDISDRLNAGDARALIKRSEKFFDSRRWVRPRERQKGLIYLLGLKTREPFDASWLPLLGKYALSKNNHGILPLIVRAMQNNLDSSLEELSFERRGGELYMVIMESGVRTRIPIGIYEYKGSLLDVKGEKYVVRTMAEAVVDVNRKIEYRIEIVFPELSSTRMIRVRRSTPHGITLTLSETPNNRIVDNYFGRISSSSSALTILINILERKFGEGFISEAIKKTFNPTIVGADMSYADYNKIVEAENERAADELNSMRLIRAVVDRFFKESPEKPNGK